MSQLGYRDCLLYLVLLLVKKYLYVIVYMYGLLIININIYGLLIINIYIYSVHVYTYKLN